MWLMGQQQGRGEALKFILPSRELEINLQPLYRVYDPFFWVFFFLNVSQVLEKRESCRRGGAEKKRVHFQGLFVLVFENVLGKSLNRQRGRSGGQVRRGGRREGLILASKSAAQPSALS